VKNRLKVASIAVGGLMLTALSCGDDESVDAEGGTSDEEPAQTSSDESDEAVGVVMDDPSTYIVKPGDTLSEIAATTCGNAGSYYSIFQANIGRRFAGGEIFKDYDDIKPGWDLNIECSDRAYDLAPVDEGQVAVGDDTEIAVEDVTAEVSPVQFAGPIPTASVGTAQVDLANANWSSAPLNESFGLENTCDVASGLTAASSSQGAGSVSKIASQADSAGIRPLIVPSNGIIVLRVSSSDWSDSPSMTIIDDSNRTLDVPRESADGNHNFSLSLVEPVSVKPRLAPGNYRYQLTDDDQTREGSLTVTAPERDILIVGEQGADNATLVLTGANATFNYDIYQEVTADCERYWKGVGVWTGTVDGWLHVNLANPSGTKSCVAESGSETCLLSLGAG
jgi:hypothetical protein